MAALRQSCLLNAFGPNECHFMTFNCLKEIKMNNTRKGFVNIRDILMNGYQLICIGMVETL